MCQYCDDWCWVRHQVIFLLELSVQMGLGEILYYNLYNTLIELFASRNTDTAHVWCIDPCSLGNSELTLGLLLSHEFKINTMHKFFFCMVSNFNIEDWHLWCALDYFDAFIIHQTLTWTVGSLIYIYIYIYVCVCVCVCVCDLFACVNTHGTLVYIVSSKGLLSSLHRIWLQRNFGMGAKPSM